MYYCPGLCRRRGTDFSDAELGAPVISRQLAGGVPPSDYETAVRTGLIHSQSADHDEDNPWVMRRPTAVVDGLALPT